MKNKKGFTLVELMIVIGVAAILAVISIPSVMKWYKKDQFIQQTREIIDMINDARTNAITEKKCSNGDRSNYWIFSIRNSAFAITCNEEPVTKQVPFNRSVDFYFRAGWDNSNQISSGPSNDNYVHIKFYSSTGISKIYASNSPESFNTKKILFNFKFPEDESVKRTICFDRIAGFPTMSLTEECDD